MTLRVADLVGAMETIAPCALAAPWDNVGLLVGEPEARLERVLLAIDLTGAVLDEACAGGAGGAVVAYHPPIFAPQKRFVGSVAYRAARAGLAVYSPHTALDVVAGGTNDVLADALELGDRAPLRALEPAGDTLKLVTFVPAEHVEAVSHAVFEAGAGQIGKYSSCSFRVAGTGTFHGDEGAKPVVGQAGRLERVDELRLETVVPVGRARDVVRALRSAHPYEEPAFDLVRLAAPPSGLGFGRVGSLARSSVRVLVERVKRALGTSHVLVVGTLDREIERAAVCAGSAGDLVDDALAAGAQLLLTGELRHHDALRAAEGGLAVICTRHSTSERAALAGLARRLSGELPGVAVAVSHQDHDPFSFA